MSNMFSFISIVASASKTRLHSTHLHSLSLSLCSALLSYSLSSRNLMRWRYT